jgi:hypothetical protein
MNHHHSDGTKYCSACLEECEAVTIDEGIGHYEYWGATGVDIQLVEVSDCCEEELLDELPEEEDNEDLDQENPGPQG